MGNGEYFVLVAYCPYCGLSLRSLEASGRAPEGSAA